MNPFFAALGRTVLERWQAANFNLAAFPDLAVAALTETPPAEHVDVAEFIHHFLLDDAQPLQSASGFGQPELIVYEHPRFYIQVLFWLEGTTDIHQHMFSGAFHVLAGSSLHTRFEFTDARSITPHLRVGRLELTSTALLPTGTTVPIVSGPGYIHSLFHLETPSLTVVVRTHTDPGSGPQFTYLPPGVAIDPFLDDTLTTRRKQLLDVLEQLDDPGYADIVGEMIARLDFERGFFILQNAMPHLRRLGRWAEVLAAFQTRHGALADGIPATLDDIVRRDGLTGLRSQIVDVEHRFFLALLLNLSRREEILRLIAERCPGDPGETIARWAAELCREEEDGTWLLDAPFPPELDVPLEDQPARFVRALRELLGLAPAGKDAASRALREALERSSLRVLRRA